MRIQGDRWSRHHEQSRCVRSVLRKSVIKNGALITFAYSSVMLHGLVDKSVVVECATRLPPSMYNSHYTSLRVGVMQPD